MGADAVLALGERKEECVGVGASVEQFAAAQLARAFLLRAQLFEVCTDLDSDASIVGARVARHLDAGVE